jgi:hypothetical protein
MIPVSVVCRPAGHKKFKGLIKIKEIVNYFLKSPASHVSAWASSTKYLNPGEAVPLKKRPEFPHLY